MFTTLYCKRLFQSTLVFAKPFSSSNSAAPFINTEKLAPPELSRYKSLPTKLTLYSRIAAYAELSKIRLSSLVVLTTLGGYLLPLSSGVDLKTMVMACAGTGLCSFSANTFNQWIEVPFDAQMARTRNRVLPRHSLSSLHAFSYGLLTGLAGSVLLFKINMIAGLIGLSNILLYSVIYTSLKRVTWLNTWVGSIVGALPPLIGTCAADPMNIFAASSWILPTLMFAWQFPHFNSLAYNLRKDYSKAGYHMLSVINPSRNSLISLKYSIAMFPISLFSTFINFSSIYFIIDSSILNSILVYFAFQFHKDRNQKTAKKLFFFTLIYLPVYIALLIIHKKTNQEVYLNFGKAHSKTTMSANPCMNPFE